MYILYSNTCIYFQFYMWVTVGQPSGQHRHMAVLEMGSCRETDSATRVGCNMGKPNMVNLKQAEFKRTSTYVNIYIYICISLYVCVYIC